MSSKEKKGGRGKGRKKEKGRKGEGRKEEPLPPSQNATTAAKTTARTAPPAPPLIVRPAALPVFVAGGAVVALAKAVCATRPVPAAMSPTSILGRAGASEVLVEVASEPFEKVEVERMTVGV